MLSCKENTKRIVACLESAEHNKMLIIQDKTAYFLLLIKMDLPLFSGRPIVINSCTIQQIIF